jgi:hypothetical protein
MLIQEEVRIAGNSGILAVEDSEIFTYAIRKNGKGKGTGTDSSNYVILRTYIFIASKKVSSCFSVFIPTK